MKKEQFTPGPWKWNSNDLVNLTTGNFILKNDSILSKIIIGDKDLIAAAPDIYEALKNVLSDLEEYVKELYSRSEFEIGYARSVEESEELTKMWYEKIDTINLKLSAAEDAIKKANSNNHAFFSETWDRFDKMISGSPKK